MWKTCNRFPMYEVDEYGDVRNKKTQKILQARTDRRGYLRLNLQVKGGKKTAYLHRLVAEAYLPNRNHLPCVNHKDENKLNNHFSNLEWCTIEYNNKYNSAVGNWIKKQQRPIVAYNNLIRLRFESITQAADIVGCVPSTIWEAINKSDPAYFKGLLWHYENDTPKKNGVTPLEIQG